LRLPSTGSTVSSSGAVPRARDDDDDDAVGPASALIAAVAVAVAVAAAAVHEEVGRRRRSREGEDGRSQGGTGVSRWLVDWWQPAAGSTGGRDKSKSTVTKKVKISETVKLLYCT
jgi:hypothetical protein